MAPPSSLENCPPEIRNNPRPYDECSPPTPPGKPTEVLPEHRFRYFSLGQELNIPLVSTVDLTVRPGILALFRPLARFALGLQMDTDFGEQLTAHTRIQGSYWISRYGMWKLHAAGLVGLRHLFHQPRSIEGGGEANVTGTLFSTGLELGLDWQFSPDFSFSPYSRFSVSPPAELSRVGEPDSKVKTLPQYELMLGMRLSWDIFPNN